MIIGITGSFGSGKTTVAKMFAKLGAYAIDADKVYHSLIRPGKSCYEAPQGKACGFSERNTEPAIGFCGGRMYKKIVKYFGKDILAKSGQIDRKKLGNIVFKDKSKLKILNSITHDEVIKGIKRIVKTKKGKVIIEAPLLIESGFYKEVDKVILVANKEEEQVKRIKEARGLSSKKILKRIRMQMPFKKKLALADFIIDNSGSKRDTLIQVKEIWKQKGV